MSYKYRSRLVFVKMLQLLGLLPIDRHSDLRSSRNRKHFLLKPQTFSPYLLRLIFAILVQIRGRSGLGPTNFLTCVVILLLFRGQASVRTHFCKLEIKFSTLINIHHHKEKMATNQVSNYSSLLYC